MKAFIVGILLLTNVTLLFAQTGTITNIRVTPKHDGSGMVEVQCDLEGQNAYNLSLEVSFDGGNTYTPVPRAHLSGDISRQTSGTDKLLLWDGLTSFPDVYSEETSLKIIALETGQNDWPRDTETQVVEVTNPETGQTWMDRNLGASRAATSRTDEQAYGDLYQWGRAADGHEKRNSGTISSLSNSDVPGHGYFITTNENSPNDWRSPQNDNLWQGVNGTNNPCPSGYRLPTRAEWDAEHQSWSSNDAAGAYASPIQLPVAGFRYGSDARFSNVGSVGLYWSSTFNGTDSWRLLFHISTVYVNSSFRDDGCSIRCIKDGTNAATLIVTTTAITDIVQTAAITGGNIIDSGGAEVTARGVVYSTNDTPTVETNEGITIDGIGTGEFTSSLTGLTPETAYYVRAYAINSKGTAYGQQVSFITLADSVIGDETEIVNVTNPQTSQTWMDRNLGASRAATSSTDKEAYGDLYQWGRAADGHQERTSNTTYILNNSDTPDHANFIIVGSEPYDWRSPQNDNLWQGVNGINNPCPNGYRLPSEAEWEAELQSWISNDGAGPFSSPLKLPSAGGRRGEDGSLYDVGSCGFYWSSTLDGEYPWSMGFSNSSSSDMEPYLRAYGFSVRCLKDATNASMLTVTTAVIADITQTTATTGGNIADNGEAEVTARGIVYSKSETPTLETNEGITTNGSGAGEFTSSLTGLTPETTYYVCAYATNSEGTVYGLQESFTTLQGDNNTDWLRDTETEVVEVTNPETGQAWMDRNLGASRAATSSTDEDAYGDLYQWGRAADGHEKRNSVTTSTLSSSDTPGHSDFIITDSEPHDWRNPQNDNLWQGVNGINNPCPDGYRLPTEAEWEAELLSWSSNDPDGHFASPLKLSLAGSRGYTSGSVHSYHVGFYWSSTLADTGARGLGFDDVLPGAMGDYYGADGFSVRCIKDATSATTFTVTYIWQDYRSADLFTKKSSLAERSNFKK